MKPQGALPPPAASAYETTPQVAIIVPFYNVAPYLDRCVKSLISQTLSPLEIVLVNDGSTDASGAIADWYAQRHPQVRVVHQENRGQGPARNAGLAVSTAPFVAFVDSDDYVTPDYAQGLLCAMRRTQADIAVCTYTVISSRLGLRSRPLMHRLLPAALTGAKALRLILRDTSIKNYSWNKLFRRTLFTDRGIIFPNICFEDIATMPRLFSRARRVAVVREPLYFYCRRKGSLLGTYTPQRIADNITALTLVRDFLIASRQYKRYRMAFAYLASKFSLYIAVDTLHLHFKQGLPHAARGAWRAYWRTLALMHTAHRQLEALIPEDEQDEPAQAMP
ncbi:MAG: glycosyltransferase [Oscillospiraceae bacterium]|jgi:glycosyltransferase involved in cell wall biosynthesis|nr:glycosyltransferase [Oscillospiraceae bacterium]